MTDTTESHDRSEGEENRQHSVGLSDDDLYRALASTQRRRALYALRESGEQTLDRLATLLAGWEASSSGRMRDASDRDRILIALHHVHLPMLADVGLVSYDSEAGRVRPAEMDRAVVDLLTRSIEADEAPSE